MNITSMARGDEGESKKIRISALERQNKKLLRVIGTLNQQMGLLLEYLDLEMVNEQMSFVKRDRENKTTN